VLYNFSFIDILLGKFPDRKDTFEIIEEQQDEITRIHNKAKSNFSLLNNENINVYSNLARVKQLPKTCTSRLEYIRCGKEKINKYKSLIHGPYYYAY
jgi:hypothetical protein